MRTGILEHSHLPGKFYRNTSVGYTGFQTRTLTYTPHFYRDQKKTSKPKSSSFPASSKPRVSRKAQLTACRTICSLNISQSCRMEIPHPILLTHSPSPGLNCPPISKAHPLVHLGDPLPHVLSSPVVQPPQA